MRKNLQNKLFCCEMEEAPLVKGHVLSSIKLNSIKSPINTLIKSVLKSKLRRFPLPLSCQQLGRTPSLDRDISVCGSGSLKSIWGRTFHSGGSRMRR
ncbi:hypothetical protein CDAR_573961 [Caerostris darwini]|uniref:Uncharacterized protein n=1 Tax=Caerostris darwini TaxID=1538125 RepID=A0AAV4T901_9ARAC|nr:hypothetical protein CDAR_573961 [Caerostris darwini]